LYLVLLLKGVLRLEQGQSRVILADRIEDRIEIEHQDNATSSTSTSYRLVLSVEE
jgi:hypothetical protein